MTLIDISNITKSFGPTVLLDGVSFTINDGDRVGFIGRNGCGKSTLFRIIAGQELYDGGRMSVRRDIDIGCLAQDPRLDESKTIGEEIESVLTEIREKVNRYNIVTETLSSTLPEETQQKLLAEQGELLSWIEHHGGWNTDYRIETVLTHLGVDDRERPVRTLSGGWRKRVALAGLILRNPDLLLLDEPTNHLDASATEWLEEYLKNYSGAVMLITHDRYFLDNVANRMFELENGALTCYTGGYFTYLEKKEERLQQEEKVQSRLLNLLRREEEWMRRGPKARGTKAKARIDRFHELEEKTDVRVRKELSIQFHTDRRLGGTILDIDNLSKSYDKKPLFRLFSLNLKQNDRIGIIGPNGCGKTTLLRIILGQERPATGSVTLGKNTRISYFDQERGMLDPEATVEDTLGEGYWVTIAGEKRHKTGYLEEFLFERSDHRKTVKTLSGGERARLIMAKLMLQGANMLVLDEPTNDLDIPTLQLLDDALISFNGCILMVTHDRFFLDKVATGILSFEDDGEVVFYEGNYEMYRTLRDQKVREKELGKAQPKGGTEKGDERRVREKKGLSYKERLELESIERKIDALETRRKEIETALADPSAFSVSVDGLGELGREFNKIEEELAVLMERWELLESMK